jgi:hypothetical protein
MSFSKAIRNGAYFDLIWAIPLALPIVSRSYVETLVWLHSVLVLDGVLPFFSSAHLLVVNLIGIQTILWTWVRLVRKESEFGRIDMVLRFFRAITMFYYYLFENVTSMLLLGAVIELYWCTIYSRALIMEKQDGRQGVPEGEIPDKYEQIRT